MFLNLLVAWDFLTPAKEGDFSFFKVWILQQLCSYNTYIHTNSTVFSCKGKRNFSPDTQIGFVLRWVGY